MIRKILLLVLLFFAMNSNAQRLLNAKSINVGLASEKKGIGASVSMEKLFGEDNMYSIEGECSFIFSKAILKNNSNTKLPIFDLKVGTAFKRYFNLGNVFPYIGGGVFVGYEFLNKKDLSNTVYLEREDTFLYGLSSKFGLEYFLGNRMSVFGEVLPNYDFGVKELNVKYNVGLKVFI